MSEDFDLKGMIKDIAMNVQPKYLYNQRTFEPGKTPLLYSGPFWDHEEIQLAMEAFLTGSWITTGTYVHRFQNIFAKTFNVKHAHMVNSGSSANLVMIAALKKHLKWNDGDEIIVSPVGFPTTIAPLVQNGLKPVFVDIEMNTLNFDIDKISEKITDRTKAIFVSPVLGNPPDMDALLAICVPDNIILVGDNCDSLGTKWNGRYLNEYYYAWSTSFYPAHHITTGEGGMVCCNDDDLIKTARSISWWGRDCHCVGQANLLACGTCGNRFSKWLVDDGVDTVMDHKYLFTNMGYNLKPLDLQGAIGLAQMKKLPIIESKRRENFNAIATIINGYKPYIKTAEQLIEADPCWFGVPIIVKETKMKQSFVDFLEKNKIQTRNYFAGNLLRHPGYKHLDDANKYPNADKALTNVFFIGCPPHYGSDHIKYLSETIEKFFIAGG